MKVMERRLFRKSGAEGPTWDPYGWEALTVVLNGVSYTLRFGALGYARLFVDGTEAMEGFQPLNCGGSKPRYRNKNGRWVKGPKDEAEVVAEWERLAGMTVEQFNKAYWRNYVPDPMGSPRMYK